MKEKHIKIEPGTENAPKSHVEQHDNMIIKIMDLAYTIHSDQIGAFPFTSQRSNRYIMVAIHIDANYIFCKLIKKGR